jgi:ComF family protein
MSLPAPRRFGSVRRLIDRLLPQDCLLCSAPAESALLCPDCSDDLPALASGGCPRCALPGTAGAPCGACQQRPPHFDALYALHPYRFPVDRLVQQLKYGHQLAIARHFGRALAPLCAAIGAERIVPMPLHPDRLAERGFNQALEIARALSRECRLPVDFRHCRRTRATAPQEGLNPEARRKNLRNAFACDTDYGGRHLLLVDDVATTGASADECARTLKAHGAARVSVVVVARTLPER